MYFGVARKGGCNMKASSRLIICALLLVAFDCHAFEMFIHTGYKNTPDFSKYGFSKSTIIYEQQIYGPKETRDDISKQNLNKISAIVLTDNSGVVILDIEHWFKNWGRKSNSQKKEVINRYSNTLDELRMAHPGHKFGYFGVVPAWAHRDIISSQKLLSKWFDENEFRKSLVESVDVLYPSLYTHDENPEEWKAKAILVLAKAKEIANGRKVIPFIWPNYSEMSVEHKYGNRELPVSYWRMQMEFLKDSADGFVIWNGALGSKGNWVESMPWWIETKDFVRDNFPGKYNRE
ncbi:MAG: hypothetical protein M0R33_09700 [Methylomonas sp.]|jgi:hypothetical protein|uniref:hypothetical protein n=1 Tax=Methylomonas sp. TaxID=418 RepID=UPI0025DEE523|nr:hypothetical protein [Methylomonas sp.]MCK9606705.1 hypothetical protein [Methylomonas sp.]